MTRARAQRLASRGALAGAVLSLLLAALSHFHLLPDTFPLLPAIIMLLAIGVGAGLLVALSRPASLLEAARRAEARGELKERLSSALLLTGGNPELLRLQQEDAVLHARGVNPVQTVPLRWPPEAKALLIVLMALFLLLWLPTLPVFLSPWERMERVVVQKEGLKLVKQGQAIERQGAAEHLEETRRAGQKLQKLGQQMAAGHMDKRQALAQASSLSKQLADAQKQASQQSNGQAQPAAGAVSQQLAQQARQAAGQSPAQAKASAGQAQQLANRTPASMSSAKAHAQAAADAQKRGDPSGAAREWRQAANAARQAEAGTHKPASSAPQGSSSPPTPDAQGVQNAQKQVDGARQEVAGAARPQDVHDVTPGQQPGQSPSPSQPQGGQKSASSGQPHGQQLPSGQPHGGQQAASGQAGQKPGGQPAQAGRNGAPKGTGRPAPGGGGKAGSAPTPGREASGEPGTEHGPGTPPLKAPHALNPAFKPSQNPGYGKVYLGQGAAGTGKTVTATPGHAGPQVSTVPVAQVAPRFQKRAEAAMDREDVPPAYKDGVRNYFNSLGQGGGNGK